VQGLTQASGASIAQVLQQHPTLQQLQLSRNSVADTGSHSSRQNIGACTSCVSKTVAK
jgi:hypothetical protein